MEKSHLWAMGSDKRAREPAKISITLGFGPTDQPVSLPWKLGLPLSQLDGCCCQGCLPGWGGSTAMTTGASGPAMLDNREPDLTGRAAPPCPCQFPFYWLPCLLMILESHILLPLLLFQCKILNQHISDESSGG